MTERLARLCSCLWLLAALVSAGCATAVPLQTASTVPVGAVRLSGQATGTAWCSFSGDLKNCAYAPGNGSVGVPELRLNGRVGVRDRVDVGLSAFTNYVFGVGFRWGGLFDGKVEVWRREIEPGRKQVLSAGVGLGLTRLEDDRAWTADLSYLQMDVVVPVRYGYQFQSLELVVGPHFIERVSFDPPGMNGAVEVPWLGLSVGFVTRRRAKFGLAVSYEAPLRFLDDGAFNVSLGFLYDIGGKDRDVAVRPLQLPAAVQTGLKD